MNQEKLLTYQPVAGLLPRPSAGTPAKTIALPAPDMTTGLPLMGALWQRHSTREFGTEALSLHRLGELLWAANGINRAAAGGHTAPSAHGIHEIDVYAALPGGLYRYDPQQHCLLLKRDIDARGLTGYQDFVKEAALDLVYVVNHGRMTGMPRQQQDVFSGVAAGAIAQNVYLYCASSGLATVVRGWLNQRQLAEAMSLNEDEVPVLAQSVGFRAAGGAAQ
ncbi:SagB/ThcOx family dehydrogenase [Cupriavidus basilensis]|uniref:SagB/ThcOx family dehydrogenase n=1 Tax=Cupriavidus basilensis TaxID=68895 RepID=UPI00075195AA|nr:SagB/ThcOx family dehydrogenase [Cupriavidus basilensis]